jgi:hypothetical protein
VFRRTHPAGGPAVQSETAHRIYLVEAPAPGSDGSVRPVNVVTPILWTLGVVIDLCFAHVFVYATVKPIRLNLRWWRSRFICQRHTRQQRRHQCGCCEKRACESSQCVCSVFLLADHPCRPKLSDPPGCLFGCWFARNEWNRAGQRGNQSAL